MARRKTTPLHTEEVESGFESTDAPDYQALYQRALADQENQRKRFEQERQATAKYGLTTFLEQLLPVVDNFDRATAHVPAELTGAPWVTGIQYIQKQLLDTFVAAGVEPIQATPGDPFDPQIHEAIGAVVSQEYPQDQVVEVSQPGYRLHDRVLRPARVVVSTAPEARTETPESEEQPEPTEES